MLSEQNYLTWGKLLPIAGVVTAAVFGAFGYLIANHSHDVYVTVREMDAVIESIKKIEVSVEYIKNHLITSKNH